MIGKGHLVDVTATHKEAEKLLKDLLKSSADLAATFRLKATESEPSARQKFIDKWAKDRAHLPGNSEGLTQIPWDEAGAFFSGVWSDDE